MKSKVLLMVFIIVLLADFNIILVFSTDVDVDLNDDGRVGITDISIAASAFGTRPGHERWDERADVNMDGEVNMLDLTLVALNFGEIS